MAAFIRSACIVIFALAVTVASSRAQAQEKVQINIVNDRNEPVVMLFEYAFRNYTWTLMQHVIDPQDEITYRFPANIPGCEHLRDWRITDGILTISNTKGPLCQKRISLCDRNLATMSVGSATCDWSVER
jgi:hypothetical protein